MGAPRINPEIRFWQKVEADPNGGCWLWGANILRGGYGQIHIKSKMPMLAHRYSWELHFGKIPAKTMVCHRCDVRACVNPSHLFLGNAKINMTDKKQKGRCSRTLGEENGASKLTAVHIKEIRFLVSRGHSQREIGEKFGVSQSSISHIKNGSVWFHVV